ncbi:hypothetical protein BpHYR1_022178 [Brachionus plicatilis]|uniref:Uncharacterized protein n=1 Tax=Brachionus plicatilis TaxID=10195 RepID=A0A3M7P2C1_BRAPC|nr:hypothetical protein BpHYR1_022178 [Brachionus plicatilis]
MITKQSKKTGVTRIENLQSFGSMSFDKIPIRYDRPTPKGGPMQKMRIALFLSFGLSKNLSPIMGTAIISNDAVATPNKHRHMTKR